MRNLFLMPNRFKIETLLYFSNIKKNKKKTLLFVIASTPPPKTAVSVVCSTTLERTPTSSRRSWTTMALPGSFSSLWETFNPEKNSNSITEITEPPHILQSRGWRTDNWINEVRKVVFGLLIFLFTVLFELFILLSMTSILIPRCRIIFLRSKTSSAYNV